MNKLVIFILSILISNCYNGQRLNILKPLSDYCLSNNIEKEITIELLEALYELRNKENNLERYLFEDTIVQMLTLENITGFEIQVYESTRYGYDGKGTNYDCSVNLSRIINRFYGEHWEGLMHSTKHLRCYLKKSNLFHKGTDHHGVANFYPNKFVGASVEELNILKSLLKNEKNSDIKDEIAFILNVDFKISANQRIIRLVVLDSLPIGEIQRIKLYNNDDFRQIVETVLRVKSSDIRLALMKLLYYQSEIEQIPILIPLLNSKRLLGVTSPYDVFHSRHPTSIFGSARSDKGMRKIAKQKKKISNKYTVSMLTVRILNFLTTRTTGYSSYYKIEKLKYMEFLRNDVGFWEKYWNEFGDEYMSWEFCFFNENLKLLEKNDSSSNEIMSNVFYSNYFSKEHYPVFYSNNVESWMLHKDFTQEDLKYFENKDISIYLIREILTNVSPIDTNQFLQFAYNKLKEKSYANKSEMYYELLNKESFRSLLYGFNNFPKEFKNDIISSLQHHPRYSDGPFWENLINKLIFDVETLKIPFQERVEIAKETENIELRGLIYKRLIEQAEYVDLPIILENAILIDKEMWHTNMEEQLLNRFGVPLELWYITENCGLVSNMLHLTALDSLKKLSGNLTEKQFGRLFAKVVHPKLYNKNNQMDYSLAYNILKYGLTNRFRSAGPIMGYEIVLPLLHALENEFGVHLGEFKNLRYSCQSKCLLWMDFLVEKQLVKKTNGASFLDYQNPKYFNR